MKKLINFYNTIEEKFCTYTFLIVIILIFAQVIARYVIGISLTWSEELSRYLYVWECWLGVSLTQREERHIKLLFLVEKFPTKVRVVLDIFATILSVACAVTLAAIGLKLVLFMGALGSVSPVLKVPMWLFYLCLPIGCIAYTVRIIADETSKITNRLVAKKEGGDI